MIVKRREERRTHSTYLWQIERDAEQQAPGEAKGQAVRDTRSVH